MFFFVSANQCDDASLNSILFHETFLVEDDSDIDPAYFVLTPPTRSLLWGYKIK